MFVLLLVLPEPPRLNVLWREWGFPRYGPWRGGERMGSKEPRGGCVGEKESEVNAWWARVTDPTYLPSAIFAKVPSAAAS